MLSLDIILVDYATFSRLIRLYSLRPRSWHRVQGRLVCMIDLTYMDSQLVTVDKFALAIDAIPESMARLGQRIEEQQAPHDQV